MKTRIQVLFLEQHYFSKLFSKGLFSLQLDQNFLERHFFYKAIVGIPLNYCYGGT
jgi:hypothetical protein